MLASLPRVFAEREPRPATLALCTVISLLCVKGRQEKALFKGKSGRGFDFLKGKGPGGAAGGRRIKRRMKKKLKLR